MPRGDRTGPAGLGPMSGRGLGYCAGYGAPGYVHPAPGRGFGGGGYGWRHWFYATGQPGWRRMAPGWGGFPPDAGVDAVQELSALKARAEQLQTALEEIHRRMDTLQSRETQD